MNLPAQLHPSIERRALAAWQRRCARLGLVHDQPNRPELVRHPDGAELVVLSNVRGILATYQLLANGSLKWQPDEASSI